MCPVQATQSSSRIYDPVQGRQSSSVYTVQSKVPSPVQGTWSSPRYTVQFNVTAQFKVHSPVQGRGKRGIKVTGALRSAGFQKIPARPQIVFNRFTCLNMLV